MNKLEMLKRDHANMAATLNTIKDWRALATAKDIEEGNVCIRKFCNDVKLIERYVERTLERNLL